VRGFTLAILAVVLAFAPSLRASDADIEVLRKAKVRRDNDSLVRMLLSCRLDDVDTAQRDKLIGQLGSGKFKEREDAGKELVAMRFAAVSALQKALTDPSAEVRRGAQRCLDAIGMMPDRDTILAAVRLMMERESPKLLETLLQYLPSAPDEDVAEDVAYDIDQLAFKDNRIHPAVLPTLADKHPTRRALAGCIVGYRGTAEQRAEVAKLLKDADALVRLRAAQGLLAAKQKDGLSVLVALLTEGPRDIAWQAEELLRYVADKTSPNAFVGFDDEKQRQACRVAWAGWLKEYEAKIDFNAPEYLIRRPGLVLLCDGDPFKGKSTFWLTGCDGTVRWEVRGNIDALDQSAMTSVAKIAWRKETHNRPEDWNGPRTGGRWQQGPTGPWLISNELLAQPAWRYAYGLLNYGGLSCGGGRILELDHLNRIKWAAFFPRDTERAIRCVNQLRTGFGYSDDDEFDLNDTLEYRLRCSVSQSKEIRRQTNEWLELQALPYLRLVPRGERLLGSIDLRGFENVRDLWEYRRLSPAEAVQATYHLDPRVRSNAAIYVSSYFPYESKLVAPYLIRLLSDPDAKLRGTSSFGLSQMCHERKKTIPLLLKQLTNADPIVRRDSWYCIGNLGHDYALLAPTLLKIEEEDPKVFFRKFEALIKISRHNKQVVSALLATLKDAKLCGTAADLLTYAGQRFEGEVTPDLLKALDAPVDEKPPMTVGATKSQILFSLARLCTHAKMVVPILIKYAEDAMQPENVRESAIKGLAWIGPDSELALPCLRRIVAAGPSRLGTDAEDAIESILGR
jgi:HEAT repeat protein